MSGGYFPDGGLFGFAAVGAVGAAGVEGTALGGIYRRGHFAFQYAPYFHPAFANVGPVRKQLGIPVVHRLVVGVEVGDIGFLA